jgi:hypothetical protein
MEKSGIFALIEISDKESDLLLNYLRSVGKTPAFDFVQYLLGSDYIKFLDLVAGTTLKVPSRRSLYRDIEYIKIYNYIKERDFAIDSVRVASKVFCKNMSFIKRAIIKMSRCLNEDIPLSVDILNSIRGVVDEGKGFDCCQGDFEFKDDLDKKDLDEDIYCRDDVEVE